MAKNWAIVIGINDYTNLQSLQFAKRDAECMQDFFLNEAGFDQVFFFTENSPPIPTYPSPIPTQPTFGHLRRFLRSQFEQPLLEAGDNLWFFFAGHGQRDAERDYFMPCDVDPGDLEHTAIPISYVTERLRRSGADNVILLIDACRNEGARGGLGIGEERHPGVITIFSCSPKEQSWEIEELKQGAFTHSLLEALRIQGEGNCATVERLYQYLYHRVPELNRHYGKYRQTPYAIAEPATKYHLILLPRYATLRDIETLKMDAFKAEAESAYDLAKQFWIRVNVAASGSDTDAIEAFERIAQRQGQPTESAQPQIANNYSGARLQRGLQNTAIPKPTRCDFYKHVSLPPNYIVRTELLAKVRASLLSDTPSLSLTSAIEGKPNALHGMGGMGKSVIARALCDDSAVRDAFPDGILWITLGQTPNLIIGMREWIQVLGGTIHENAPTVNSLKANLAQLLEKRACLLIVDDAWEFDHLKEFQVSGPRCRLLVTTRKAAITRNFGASIQPIPPMTMPEAVKLLEDWAEGNLTQTALEFKEQIAQRLVRLPLALKLAGAQMRNTSAQDWLQRFNKLRDLDAEWNATRPEDSLMVCFNLSLQALKEKAHRLYITLGIFREDEATPETAIAKLWGEIEQLSAEATTKLLNDLASQALLELQPEQSCIVLHDLLRQMICEELGQDEEQVHAAIVNAYRKIQQGEGWHTVPDDGYFFQHLAYHLRKAGRKEELYTLLTGSPDWMEAKFIACTGDAAYVDDLELALSDFATPKGTAQLLTLLQLHLARQVANYRVRHYDNTELKTLVWLGNEAEALSHSRLRSKAKDRVDGLLTIHNTLREKGQPQPVLLEEIQREVWRIEDNGLRLEVLKSLTVALVQEGQFTQAQQVVEEIDECEQRVEIFTELAANLAKAELRGEARVVFAPVLEAIESVKDSKFQLEALIQSAISLVQLGDRTQARDVLLRAREIAWETIDYASRVRALTGIAKALEQAKYHTEARTVFVEAQKAIRAIENHGQQTEARRDLAATLIQIKQFSQAQQVAQEIRDYEQKSEILRELAIALVDARRLTDAEYIIEKIEDYVKQADALGVLAPALIQVGSHAMACVAFAQAMRVAAGVGDCRQRAIALRKLVVILAHTKLFDQARKVAKEIDDLRQKAVALGEITAALNQVGYKQEAQTAFNQAMQVTGGIEDCRQKAGTLRELATTMIQARLIRQALQVTDEIVLTLSNHPLSNPERSHDRLCASILGSLASTLVEGGYQREAKEVFSRAWSVAKSIEDDWRQAGSLKELATNLGQTGQYTQAQQVIEEIKDASLRMRALKELAPTWTQVEHYTHARQVSEEIKDVSVRMTALKELAAALAQAGRHVEARTCFSQARQLLWEIKNDWQQADLLRQLAKALVWQGNFIQAYQIVGEIEDDWQKAEALKELAVLLVQKGCRTSARAVFAQARLVTLGLKSDWQKAEMLIVLATSLAQIGCWMQARAIFTETRQIVERFKANWHKAQAIRKLNIARIQAGSQQVRPRPILTQAWQILGIRYYWKYWKVLLNRQTKVSRKQTALTQSQFADTYEVEEITFDEREKADFESLEEMRKLTRSAQFSKALISLSEHGLYKFLETQAQWRDDFEQVESGLSMAVLRETVRISSWLSADLRKIYEIVRIPSELTSQSRMSIISSDSAYFYTVQKLGLSVIYWGIDLVHPKLRVVASKEAIYFGGCFEIDINLLYSRTPRRGERGTRRLQFRRGLKPRLNGSH